MSPTSIFAPASTPADAIAELSYFVVAVAGEIFLVVAGLLVYAVVRFRTPSHDHHHEPAQVYGSNEVEIDPGPRVRETRAPLHRPSGRLDACPKVALSG